ncbi:MAG: hypothetical protein CEE38_02440 [Planctomycetes bacterium B3_Pla]|nr:MAG: hypothetical protein CEE38_02440 [Planctomycetes bacterium B3_Pla]
MGMQKFLEGRINFVKDLLRSDMYVSYGDIVLITCAVLSACAAYRWPKQGKSSDQKRFTSLIIEHSPPEFRTSWISIPALLNDGLISEHETLWGTPGNECRILCGDEIDLSMEEAILKFPQISREKVQQYSYASLIYKWLRCAYSHEYCPHVNITEVQASRKAARVSYIGRLSDGRIKRMVAFHLDYLIELAEYHVSVLPADVP